MAMAASTSTSLSVVGSNLAFPRHPPATSSSARFRTRLRNNRFFLSSSLPRYYSLFFDCWYFQCQIRTFTVANSSCFSISDRRRLKAVCGGGLGLRRNNSRGGLAFVVGEPSFLLPQQSCASCCLARKRRSNLSTFVPGAFLDKSSFRLSNNKLNRSPVSFLSNFILISWRTLSLSYVFFFIAYDA